MKSWLCLFAFLFVFEAFSPPEGRANDFAIAPNGDLYSVESGSRRGIRGMRPGCFLGNVNQIRAAFPNGIPGTGMPSGGGGVPGAPAGGIALAGGTVAAAAGAGYCIYLADEFATEVDRNTRPGNNMFDGLTNSQIDDLSNSLDPTKAAFYENAWNYWTTGW